MRFREFMQRESIEDYLAIKNDNPWWYLLTPGIALGAAALGGLGRLAVWGYDRITGKHAEDAKRESMSRLWSHLRYHVENFGVNDERTKKKAQEFVNAHPEITNDIKAYIDRASKEEPNNNKLFNKAVVKLQAAMANKFGGGPDGYKVRDLMKQIEERYPQLSSKLQNWLAKQPKPEPPDPLA